MPIFDDMLSEGQLSPVSVGSEILDRHIVLEEGKFEYVLLDVDSSCEIADSAHCQFLG